MTGGSIARLALYTGSIGSELENKGGGALRLATNICGLLVLGSDDKVILLMGRAIALFVFIKGSTELLELSAGGAPRLTIKGLAV